MTDARCEPRPNGWYWREDVVTGHLTLCRWVNSTTTTNRLVGARFSSSDYPLSYSDDELSPVLTPAEVAALRAERDAAVAEATAYGRAVDHWMNMHHTAETELTTIRAEVEKLRGALDKFGFGTDLDAHLKLTGALIDMEHKPEAPPDRVCWATLNRVVAQLQAARAALEPQP